MKSVVFHLEIRMKRTPRSKTTDFTDFTYRARASVHEIGVFLRSGHLRDVGGRQVDVLGEGEKKSEINPMEQSQSLSHLIVSHPVSRCGAKTRAGPSCRRPPVRGRKRCRLHGGLSPGAPRGSRNGNYTNGDWTREALEERRWVRDLVRSFGKLEAI